MIYIVYTHTEVLNLFYLVLTFIGHSRPRFHHLFNLPCHKLAIFLAQTLKADAVLLDTSLCLGYRKPDEHREPDFH